jgi:hypothetical protein
MYPLIRAHAAAAYREAPFADETPPNGGRFETLEGCSLPGVHRARFRARTTTLDPVRDGWISPSREDK